MTDSQQLPPHAPILAMTSATIVAQALRAVVALDVPTLLADGPLSVDDLAAKTGTRPQLLARVLRTLAAAGLFTTTDDVIDLTPTGATLVAGHPTAARGLVLTMVGPLFTAGLQQLPETLRTGQTGARIAFGQEAFAYFGEHPEEATSFNQMMIAFHGSEPAAVTAAYDFGATGHIVDVGGGVGTFLRTILAANTGMRGTLFDQPAVVDQADLAGVTDRIETVGGDFFQAVPAGGDVYLLSHILHDWKDDQARAILTRCRDAMTPTSRLLIVEMLVPSADVDHPGKMLDMIMLSLAGGQERTEPEYRDLLASAGLQLTRTIPTRSAVTVMEAGKA